MIDESKVGRTPILKVAAEQPGSEKATEAHVFSLEFAEQMESFYTEKIGILLLEAEGQKDKKSFVIKRIADVGRTWFRGRETLLQEILTAIEEISGTDAELQRNAAKKMTKAVLRYMVRQGISEEEARRGFRMKILEQSGQIPLVKDGAVAYDRFEDKIDLHLRSGLTMRTFEEAMVALAPIVQSDESIRIIKGTSWIVAQYPKVLARMGFTIDDALSEEELRSVREDLPTNLRDKPIAEAHMTREEFLRRWPAPEEKSSF